MSWVTVQILKEWKLNQPIISIWERSRIKSNCHLWYFVEGNIENEYWSRILKIIIRIINLSTGIWTEVWKIQI